MNKQINHYRLQVALAQLIVNPTILLSNSIPKNKLIKNFNLSDLEQEELMFFLMKEQKKFAAAARVLKKRRIDSIIKSFYLFTFGFSTERIRLFFENYFSSLEINQRQSMNPYREALIFFQYLLDNEHLTIVERALIEYDKMRSIAKIKYAENQLRPNCPAIIYRQRNLCVTPFIIAKNFDFNINELIEYLQNHNELIYKPDEQIVFYLHLQKKIISSLSVKTDFLKFILDLKQAECVKELLTIDNDVLEKYLAVAERHGLVMEVADD